MPNHENKCDWIWGGAILAAITALVAVAATKKPTSRRWRILQGGTNPIVLAPSDDITPTDGGEITVSVYPSVFDARGTKYEFRALRFDSVDTSSDVVIKLKETGVPGIKSTYSGETITVAGTTKPIPVKVPLQALGANDTNVVIAFAVYNANRFGFTTIEFLK